MALGSKIIRFALSLTVQQFMRSLLRKRLARVIEKSFIS
jgi:hypothetical protein